jgi:hypothetical protein
VSLLICPDPINEEEITAIGTQCICKNFINIENTTIDFHNTIRVVQHEYILTQKALDIINNHHIPTMRKDSS